MSVRHLSKGKSTLGSKVREGDITRGNSSYGYYLPWSIISFHLKSPDIENIQLYGLTQVGENVEIKTVAESFSYSHSLLRPMTQTELGIFVTARHIFSCINERTCHSPCIERILHQQWLILRWVLVYTLFCCIVSSTTRTIFKSKLFISMYYQTGKWNKR